MNKSTITLVIYFSSSFKIIFLKMKKIIWCPFCEIRVYFLFSTTFWDEPWIQILYIWIQADIESYIF